MCQGYEPNVEDVEVDMEKAMIKAMKKYGKDFNIFCDELENSKVLTKPIIYKNYYNDYVALENVFKKLGKNYKDIMKRKISLKELKWIEACHNGGHTHLNEKYTDKKSRMFWI